MDKNTALENIDSLRLPELRALFAEVTGETTKAPNKKYLIRRIREALAEQAAEVIEEEQAIERMQTAPAGDEPSAEQDAAPAKPKAKRTRRGVKKAAPTNTAPSLKATAADAEPMEPASVEGSEPAQVEHADEDATEPASTGHQDAPADEELDAFAAAADLADAAAESASQGADNGKPLRDMTVQELQQRYLEVVGRPTGSSHRRYLVWKIREAQKGRIPVGPRNRRNPGEPTPDFQILPVRMEAELVKQLDDARERLGLKSRMDLFRKALSEYLRNAGETDLAAAIAPNA